MLASGAAQKKSTLMPVDKSARTSVRVGDMAPAIEEMVFLIRGLVLKTLSEINTKRQQLSEVRGPR